MQNKSCFFIGHQDTPDRVRPLLQAAINKHIEEFGVRDFYVGRHGAFDRMVAEVVAEDKKRCPELRLVLVLPYHPAIRPVEKQDIYDSTYYPWEGERIPQRLAILKTNQRMVDSCDYLIAYAWHFLGGSGKIVEYARKREKRGLIGVENLAREERPDAP